MDGITPKAYEPPHQPFEGRTVSFLLKPLDLKGQYQLQAAIDGKGVPSWDGIEVAARYIVGWKGLPPEDGVEPPFSRQKLAQVLAGGADVNWMLWLPEIAGRLYRDSILSEIERKN